MATTPADEQPRDPDGYYGDTDGYYGDDQLGDDELDLSFLDEDEQDATKA